MRKTILILWLMYSLLLSAARDTTYVSGGIQHNGLFPTTDISSIRSISRSQWALIDHLSNTYLDFSVHYVRNGSIQSQFRGLRFTTRAELTRWPLPGYEKDFGGYGISNLSLTAIFNHCQISIGDIYSQFGSGFTLNLYEDRGLGVDNPLRGFKSTFNPYEGISVTMLGGKQRHYWQCYNDNAFGWNYSRDFAGGADMTLNIDRWSRAMRDIGMYLAIGGSYVTKYEHNDTIISIIDKELYMYRLPLWVGAGEVRGELQYKGINVMIEYARKANDPSNDNAFSYRQGDALLVSATYSRRGFSFLAQVKRSDNMSFRSQRLTTGLAGRLNLMPAFAQQHTYALASLYPYATQYAGGEWAFQTEVRYTAPKRTKFGGRYGTTLKLSASHIRGLAIEGSLGIDTTPKGEYYTDINIELNKHITKRWWLNTMIMYQTYNRTVVEGEGGMVRSGIAVVDSRVNINRHLSLRTEMQYLYSINYQGQWVFALCELSIYNYLSVSGQWMYNVGNAPDATKEHFYSVVLTYNNGSHRVSTGYVKTRDGYNCSGGICRYVPKQEGVTVNYSFTF